MGGLSRIVRSLVDDLKTGLPPDRIDEGIVVRDPTPGERSGRRVLIRAAASAVVGGVVIAAVSAAFGSRLFAADARIWGLFCGMAIAALGALAPIGPDNRKLVHGALIVVLAIVSFPIALGGYVFGALAAVVGGAMLVGYEPPNGETEIRTQRAGLLRRLVALVVDFAVAFLAQRVVYLLVGDYLTNTVNVVVSWALVWFAVAVEPALLTRRTAGRLLLSLRVADWRTGHRSSPVGAAIREIFRGVIVIGTLFAVAGASLRDSFELSRGLLMLAVIVGLVALAEAADLLGRVSGTMSAHDAVVAAQPDGATAPAAESGASTGDGAVPSGAMTVNGAGETPGSALPSPEGPEALTPAVQ